MSGSPRQLLADAVEEKLEAIAEPLGRISGKGRGGELVLDPVHGQLRLPGAALAPHVGGAYANFLSSAAATDVAAIYPAEVYNRLAAVKRQYDPGDLFAGNHNVRPHEPRLLIC